MDTSLNKASHNNKPIPGKVFCLVLAVAALSNIDRILPLLRLSSSTTNDEVLNPPVALASSRSSGGGYISLPQEGEEEDFPTEHSPFMSASSKNSTAVRPQIEPPNNQNNNKHKNKTKELVYYSYARKDRSGQTIWDMLKAHAACHKNGWIYGGACGDSIHREDVEQLIHALDLDHLIFFSCPSHRYRKSNYIPKDAYLHNEVENFTPEWLEYMAEHAPLIARGRSNKSLLSSQNEGGGGAVTEIAVHIRRGDVSLCTNNAMRRYLPNSHYIRLLDEYLETLTTPYHVTIYSESQKSYAPSKRQYEGFDEFIARNYTLNLDGNMADVWRDFINADVLITAKSGFSLVPALLRYNRGGVIFTPHKFAHPLPHWQVLDDDFLEETNEEMELMRAEKCPPGTTTTTTNDNDNRRQRLRRLQFF